MKKTSYIVLAILLIASKTFAQSDTSSWKKGGLGSIGLSQSSFTNWAAGGISNTNITSLLSLFANQKLENSTWENNLDLGFGTQKIENADFRKSEDRIELNSKYGRKINDKLNYSALFNFRSQFAQGFNYTDTSVIYVSNIMAPSFTTISAGLDYRPAEGLSIYFSPVTGKITTVLDTQLSNQGAYGVDTGKKVRFEFGALASIKYQKVFKNNIQLKSKLDLFGNFENFQAIDINWENIFAYQITKLLTVSLTSTLLYDQDILIAKEVEQSPGVFVVENKPRTQFKQVFALGLTYKF
jgi:Protein of unknown function (DUF3078)